jgi:glycosyltransferase involved in cell wall biosynthesis
MEKLDVIIPVKNEAHNIKELVERASLALNNAEIPFRLIFIDDNSTDQTVTLIKKLSEQYPINLYKKIGKPGKAYSIIEGAAIAQTELVVMLDADLQYPPEATPRMFEAAKYFDVVVGNRLSYKGSFIRKIASRFNAFIFGRVLFGFRVDV